MCEYKAGLHHHGVHACTCIQAASSLTQTIVLLIKSQYLTEINSVGRSNRHAGIEISNRGEPSSDRPTDVPGRPQHAERVMPCRCIRGGRGWLTSQWCVALAESDVFPIGASANGQASCRRIYITNCCWRRLLPLLKSARRRMLYRFVSNSQL